MTPENLTILSDELVNDPVAKGYAIYLPDAPGHVVRLLMEVGTDTVRHERFLTERGVMGSQGLGPVAGAAFLDKLDAVAASGAPGTAPLKRIMKYLYSGDGIDIGDAATAASLQALVGMAGITQPEVDRIQGMALRLCSRAEKLGLGNVDILDVIGVM
jgi:hypothetical protein